MLYFLHGPNSFSASKKIKEIKNFFLKKNPNFLIEEIDGEENMPEKYIYGATQNPSLFGGKRLFIFRNALKSLPDFESFLDENINNLKNSENIFVFWEKDIKKKDKYFSVFEKNAEKVQETKLEEVAENLDNRNGIFRVVDGIFVGKTAKTVFVLRQAMKSGIIPKDLVNVIFWNFKRKSKISIREAGLAFETMLTDMNLKMDSKNEAENLAPFENSR